MEGLGLLEKRISELERRQNHISKIDPNHPLLATALKCLNDEDVKRPSAEELHGCVASLKRDHKNSESMRVGEEQGREVAEREESLQQQCAQQIEGLQRIIQSQVACLQENDETIAAGLQEIQQLRECSRDQMHQLENERNRKDSEILKLTTRINELELQLSMKDQDQVQQSIVSSGADGKDSIKLKWREGKKAPCKISNSYVGLMAAAVDGDTVYVMENAKIYAYNASINAWSQLPNSKFEGCALAIVNNLLTLIGGWNLSNATSTLLSLTRR